MKMIGILLMLALAVALIGALFILCYIAFVMASEEQKHGKNQ